jgi:hypothetical protein
MYLQRSLFPIEYYTVQARTVGLSAAKTEHSEGEEIVATAAQRRGGDRSDSSAAKRRRS